MRERVEASAQIAIARIVRFDFFVAGCVATDLVAHAASTQTPLTSGTWLLDSRFRGNERSVLHRSRASQPRLDFETATAPHPLVVARGLRLMSLPFAGKARGDGAPISATSLGLWTPLIEAPRLSALHRGVFRRTGGPKTRSGPHRRRRAAHFGNAGCSFSPALPISPIPGFVAFTPAAKDRTFPSASSWQEAVVPPGGAPTPPGCGSCEEPRAGTAPNARRELPRAVRRSCGSASPLPPSGLLRLKTPHEAPLCEQGDVNMDMILS